MADSKQLELLAKGPERWNEWRRAHPLRKPDLRDAYLPDTDLSEYDLRGADFSGAVLMAARFRAADLRDAVFSDSDLRYAELRGARLRGARFDGSRGVPRATVRAAAGARAPRRRLTTLLPLSAAVAALAAAAGYLAVTTVDGATPLASDSRADPAAGLDGAEKLTLALRGVSFPGWRLAAVDIDESVLTVRIDRESVGENVYLPTIGVACGAWLESDVSLREIRVLNRAGRGGWVYADPSHYRALIDSPLEAVRLVAAADTRPFENP